MDNVYNEPGAETEERHLLNNTAAEMSAGLGKCQLGIETDTKRIGYSDDGGTYHSAPLLTEAFKVKVSDTDDAEEYLDEKVKAKASSAIAVTTDVGDDHLEIATKVDDSTIGISGSNTLEVKNLGITDAKVAVANKDGTAATPSMRTLGTSSTSACAGDDSRLSDARTPTAHDLAGSLHNVDTITNLNSKLSDGDVLSTKASEINALTAKSSPTSSDLLVIEDVADSNSKKKITISSIPAASPAAHDLAGALHNADTITNLNSKLSDGDVLSTKTGEFNAFTAKSTPVVADIVPIEDSAASNAKKKITYGDTMKMNAIVEPGGTTTQIVMYYGTGSPPSAVGKPNGTLFFKYTA
jgi:lysozyme family protein